MTGSDAIRNHFNGRMREFYQRYVELPEGNGQAMIHSPFRTERVASFSIDLDGDFEGRWKDFGTDENGDLFEFYARKNELRCDTDFPRIVEGIAADFGISLPAQNGGKSRRKKTPEEVLQGFREALVGSSVQRDLKERRGLSDETIDKFELGCYQGQLVFPVRAEEGEILGFKVHKGPHLKPDGTKAKRGEGVKAQIYRSPSLHEGKVWIAGGEPDVWRLDTEDVPAVCGTAGEGTFKDEWVEFFAGRDVVIAFHNDEVGRKAQRRCVKLLKGRVGRLSEVQWPDGLDEISDVTDWLQSGRTLAVLPDVDVKEQRVTLDDVKAVVRKWLHLGKGEDIIVDVVLGVIVANRFGGDPVWLFLVGPPGIIKTEILRTLSEWHEAYMLSSLTASTLISGYVPPGGEDPSLLPKLDGKVLVIKDFTAILDMHREARQVILGELRDAYDGQMSKAFGSEAGTRSYKSHFGLMAAVTPAIDKYWGVGQQLGERFLKIRVRSSDPRSRIRRAMLNSGHEGQMRDELAEAMEGALSSCAVSDELAIEVSPELQELFIDLADCLAVLRSVVARDGHSKEIEYVPEPEIGTRLVKQFMKLARGIAAVRGNSSVGHEEFATIIQIARDTLPSKRYELVRAIYGLFDQGFQSTQRVADRMRMPTETAKIALQDLRLLKVVERQGQKTFEWLMEPNLKERLDVLGFFKEEQQKEGVDTPPDTSSAQNEDEQASRDEMSGGGEGTVELDNDIDLPPDISAPQNGEGTVSRDEVSGGTSTSERETWTL